MLKFKCGKFSLQGLIRKLKEGVMAALRVQILLLYTCVSDNSSQLLFLRWTPLLTVDAYVVDSNVWTVLFFCVSSFIIYSEKILYLFCFKKHVFKEKRYSKLFLVNNKTMPFLEKFLFSFLGVEAFYVKEKYMLQLYRQAFILGYIN